MLLMSMPVVLPFDLAPLWDEAMDYVGMKQEAMAALMGTSAQSLDQAKRGVRRFPLDRLLVAAMRDTQARQVFVRFMRSVLRSVGADEREEVLALFNDAVNEFQVWWASKPRPAKAPESVTRIQERKSA